MTKTVGFEARPVEFYAQSSRILTASGGNGRNRTGSDMMEIDDIGTSLIIGQKRPESWTMTETKRRKLNLTVHNARKWLSIVRATYYRLPK